jgi:hypothetical protein
MKKQELNNKVLQTLQEFESIPSLQPTEAWEQDLMSKIDTAKLHHASPISKTKIIVVILFIAAINIGFLLSAVVHHSHQTLSRNSDLQVISKEFLINPTSLNN